MSLPNRTYAAVATVLASLVLSVLVATPASGAQTAPAVLGTTAERKQATPVAIRVLQYNIRYGSRGLDRVAHDIRRTGAGVVVLNEVDDNRRTGGVHQARYLARRLGMRAVFDANIRTRHGHRGNAVLTRFPVRDVARHDLFVPPGTRPRGLVRVRLAVRGIGVDVWGTHLNVGRGTLRQARGTAAIIGRPTCATILGGDMNAGPGSPEDRVLRTHLQDVWRAVGRGPGHTNFRGIQRIDYLYHRHTTPLRTWVTPLRASDHRGVVGIVRLHRARSC
jgi:endonuclease/exonuclease/phosphatase family metal-dependent hydrolase